MKGPNQAFDQAFDSHSIDTAFHVGGMLVRAVVYAARGAVASHYDCGRALLTGVLLGDVAATMLDLVWRGWARPRQAAVEFAVVAVIFLCVRSTLVWPDEQAECAILGLAAFGVFAGRAGGTVLTHLGPRENGFA